MAVRNTICLALLLLGLMASLPVNLAQDAAPKGNRPTEMQLLQGELKGANSLIEILEQKLIDTQEALEAERQLCAQGVMDDETQQAMEMAEQSMQTVLAEVTTLKTIAEVYKARSEELAAEVEKLKIDVPESEQQLQEILLDATTSLQEAKERIKEQQQTIEDYETALAGFSTEEGQTWEEGIAATNESLNTLLELFEEQKKVISQYETALNTAYDRIAELETEVDAAYQKERKEKEFQVQDDPLYQEVLQALKDTLADEEELQKQTEEALAKVAELEQKIADSADSQEAAHNEQLGEVVAALGQAHAEIKKLKIEATSLEEAKASAETKVAELEQKLADSVGELKAAHSERLGEVVAALGHAHAEIKKLKIETTSLEEAKASLRIAAEQWQEKYETLQDHHASSYLPHYVDETLGVVVAQSSGYVLKLKDGFVSVMNQAIPMAQTIAAFVKDKAATVINYWASVAETAAPSAIETIKKAKTTVVDRLSGSNAASKATSAVGSGLSRVGTELNKVLSEVEALVVTVSKSHTALETVSSKPYSTVAALFILLAPVVAIGMPLLASSSKSTKSTGRKIKQEVQPATPASVTTRRTSTRKKRISIGTDTISVP